MSSSPRPSPLVPIAVAAALVGGAIAWLHRPPRVADDPLAACPAGAFLVAKLDVVKLRASPLAPLAEQALSGLVPEAARACDLASHLDAVVLTVPEGDERSDLGFALKLRMTPSELASCARAAAGEGATPERKGGFAFVPAKLGHADTLAAADNGLVLVGERTWVEAMAAAASGRAPSAVSAAPHDAALRALGGRALAVSVALPKATRARIRREMESELTESDRKPMEGVLGVEGAGAALDLRAEDADVAVVLRCATGDACGSVKALVEKKKQAWTASPIVRLLGLGAAASSLTVVQSGPRLEATAHLATSDLRSALETALAFRKPRKPSPAPVPTAAAAVTPALAPPDGGAEGPAPSASAAAPARDR